MEVFPSKTPRNSHGQISVAIRNRIYRELPPVTPEIIERWATQRSFWIVVDASTIQDTDDYT